MSWQKCPKCNGEGTEIPKTWTMQTIAICTVCDGKKIIHTATGKPPKENNYASLGR